MSRTAIRAAAVTVLAAAAVTAGAATAPAAAPAGTPSTVVVSVPSVSDGSDPKTATAPCPATHPYVYGAGGQVTGGEREVVLTAAVPEAKQVTVRGNEHTPTTLAWSVTAHAICGTVKPTQVPAVVPDSLSTPKRADALCPDETELYGTGYELTGTVQNGLPTQVLPMRDLSGVTVSALGWSGAVGGWGLIGYAVCGTPVRSQLVVAAADAQGAAPPLAGPCPTDTYLSGVGAELTNGAGAWLNGMFPNGNGTSSAIEGVWYVTLATLTTYAICVP